MKGKKHFRRKKSQLLASTDGVEIRIIKVKDKLNMKIEQKKKLKGLKLKR